MCKVMTNKKQNVMNDLSKYLHKSSGTSLTLALHVTKY